MEQAASPMSSPPIQHLAQEGLQKVRSTCDRMQILTLGRQIEACEGLLVENPPIDVAILGQFKAGKSSFVNSLIGQNVLPVGVIPVTTVISRLQFGEQERATVSFFDGTRKEIPIAELDEYTAEAKNPSNQKSVEMVDIELPALADYAGLRLVDTPGLGSVFKAHMEVSANWLPEVGAAVLAVSADRPLSENDLQLIRELTQYTPRIILLLTKADLLSPSQQDEVVKFFEDTVKRELNREFPIFLYSTKTDTERFRHRLEVELFFKLAVNRDFEFRKILQHKVNSVIRGCSRLPGDRAEDVPAGRRGPGEPSAADPRREGELRFHAGGALLHRPGEPETDADLHHERSTEIHETPLGRAHAAAGAGHEDLARKPVAAHAPLRAVGGRHHDGRDAEASPSRSTATSTVRSRRPTRASPGPWRHSGCF